MRRGRGGLIIFYGLHSRLPGCSIWNLMRPRNHITRCPCGKSCAPRRAAWGILLTTLLLFAPGMIANLRAQGAPGGGAAIQGRVLNGTTGAPVANAQVNYVRMSQGMTPLATATTGPDGRFRLEGIPPAAGPAPALLRVDHQGATYSQPMLPGSPSEGIEIQVYDASADRAAVSVAEQAIFLHPAGSSLAVLEQIIMENQTSPPRAYVNPEGTYVFTLPQGAREGVRVTVNGPGGMPIGQEPRPRGGPNQFAIDYPIRPGETQIRVEYSMDYASPLQFEKPIDLKAQQTHIVTTGPEVVIQGEGIAPLDRDPSSGFMGYLVNLTGTTLRVNVSGESAAPAEGSQTELSEGGGSTLAPILPPIAAQRLWIMAAAGLLLLGGFVYLYRI